MRSLKLRSQPGDVCLPGGKVDKDESVKGCKARELKEELLLEDEDFHIVGEMDYFISPYGNQMYCFVAELYKSQIAITVKRWIISFMYHCSILSIMNPSVIL